MAWWDSEVPFFLSPGPLCISQLERFPSCYNSLSTGFCTAPSRLCRLCSTYKVESRSLFIFVYPGKEGGRQKQREKGGMEGKNRTFVDHSFIHWHFFIHPRDPGLGWCSEELKENASCSLKKQKINKSVDHCYQGQNQGKSPETQAVVKLRGMRQAWIESS